MKVKLKNFGSYSSLEFDFSSLGLCLIQGPTGAGKSTLMDAIPWVLYGLTAKDGSVDEVRKWNTSTTEGYAYLENLSIHRIRGRQAKDNDLYYIKNGETVRGKDLVDTQKQISSLLGQTSEKYLSSSYFHEFSQSASFFTTSAKQRRDLIEQVVDLSLCLQLQDKAKELEKSLKSKETQLFQVNRDLTQKISIYQSMETEEAKKSKQWVSSHEAKTDNLLELIKAFEANRRQVIKNTCRSCGTKLSEPREIYDDSSNPHLTRLEDHQKQENPYSSAVKSYEEEISITKVLLTENLSGIDRLTEETSDLSILGDSLKIFRSRLIESTVSELETTTNETLEKYFDAEIMTSLSMEGDKLDVTLQKDGNACSFTQLSKGQRCLLKLSFAVAVMKALHKQHTVKTLFFDEALSGLDDNNKAKAFSLFQALETEYPSILVIDHSEGLKALFDNQYTVSLNNGDSSLACTT